MGDIFRPGELTCPAARRAHWNAAQLCALPALLTASVVNGTQQCSPAWWSIARHLHAWRDPLCEARKWGCGAGGCESVAAGKSAALLRSGPGGLCSRCTHTTHLPFSGEQQAQTCAGPPWQKSCAGQLRVPRAASWVGQSRVPRGAWTVRVHRMPSVPDCAMRVQRAGPLSQRSRFLILGGDGDKSTFCVCGSLTMERTGDGVKGIHVWGGRRTKIHTQQAQLVGASCHCATPLDAGR